MSIERNRYSASMNRADKTRKERINLEIMQDINKATAALSGGKAIGFTRRREQSPSS